MSATAAVVRTFTVADFTAEVSLQRMQPGAVHCASVEWSPNVPDFYRDFTQAQRDEYQQKLLAAVSEVCS